MNRAMSGGSQSYAHCKGQLLVVTVSVPFLLLKTAVSGIQKVNVSLCMIAYGTLPTVLCLNESCHEQIC